MQKLNALIIDDEIDICFILTNILRRNNINSKYVNRIEDARTLLEKESPALIFLDNRLPDGLGINFVNDIKQRLAPDAKVIMITAFDSPDDRRLASERGVDVFLSKPLETKSILAAIS